MPRSVVLNCNLEYYNENNIVVREYPECFEGVIYSYVDRYGASDSLVE